MPNEVATHDLTLLMDLAFTWLAALLAGVACIRMRMPTMLGYILAGIAVGPAGLKLISNHESILVLAEMGVALLLFALGVELSLKKILETSKSVLMAGVLQMVLTTALCGSLLKLFGLAANWNIATIAGFACALSSTVVVSKMLIDSGTADAAHGRLLIPILLVQDLMIVLFVVFLPILGGKVEPSLTGLSLAIGKAAIILPAVFYSALKIIPRWFSSIAVTNSREIFILTVICVCLCTSLLCQSLGFSLALGAFMAGLVITESEYAHQALADVLPIKELFSTIFFASLGMLLDFQYLQSNWGLVLGATAALILVKSILGSLSSMVATASIATTLMVGLGLAQMGEFSFVLSAIATHSGALPASLANLINSAAIGSLLFAPIAGRFGPQFAKNLMREPGEGASSNEKPPLTKHTISCGFGRVGQDILVTLESEDPDMKLLVIDLAVDPIEKARQKQIPHIYGDATSMSVLQEAGLREAKNLIVSLPDVVSAVTTIKLARMLNQDLFIIARAHSDVDATLCLNAGANRIIQPEKLAAKQIAQVLTGKTLEPHKST